MQGSIVAQTEYLARTAMVMVATHNLSNAKRTLRQLKQADPKYRRFGTTVLVNAGGSGLEFQKKFEGVTPIHLIESSEAKTNPALRPRIVFEWAIANIDTSFEWICFCEDDVRFREGFTSYLNECLREVYHREALNTIIALYSPHSTSQHPHADKGRYYVSYPPEEFLGTQCLIVPRTCFRDILDFIERTGLHPEEPLDILLNLYARTRDNLVASKISLVQHLHKGCHSSPSFSKVWMPGPALAQHFQRLANAAIRSKRPMQPARHPKGIVICAGGLRYFTCAWVCINMLRHLKCDLPIEVWHLGPAEMSDSMKALLVQLGVRCVDAFEMRKKRPVRLLAGWELKCYSILYSDFDEVLLLDADNVPVRDPSYLFESPEYLEQGAVFWPDLGCTSKDRDIWQLTGVPYRHEREFESGQILVNKTRCWTALVLAMHYNEHSDFYYQHIYGDKDTFRFAFRKIGKDYAMPDRGIKHLGGTLCQHDFDGQRLFQHRIKKWSLKKNSTTDGFLFEEKCFGFLDDLRRRWKSTGVEAPGARAPQREDNRRVIITLRAPIGCSTGYELHARQLFADLRKLKYKVQVISTAIVEQYAPVPKSLRRCFVPDDTEVSWELLLHPPFYKPLAGRRTIYFTMWESSRLPRRAVTNLNKASDVIVPCRWNAECFRESGVTVPIHVIPLGIKTDVFQPAEMDMDGPCVFGTAGRSDSDPHRKCFSDIIPLFLKAFPTETDVKLKIKVFPHCKVKAVTDPRIEIERSFLSERQLAAWFQGLTCFVSMSRSEGWGLMQHQALATGRPVIGSIYGGMAEFFKEPMGYPVPFRLVPAKGKFKGNGVWAEPDDSAIIERMREVYRNRNEARRRGITASEEVADFSWFNSHQRLAKLLSELGYTPSPSANHE